MINIPDPRNWILKLSFLQLKVAGSGTSTAAVANGPNTAVDAGKMSKDSILALFGSRPTAAATNSSPAAIFGAATPAAFSHPTLPG
jgi:hypothetical protein